MKYEFEKTILEGAMQKTDAGYFQKVSVISSLQKEDGTEIMKLTDTIDVPLVSESITKYKIDFDEIDNFARIFLNEKYGEKEK